MTESAPDLRQLLGVDRVLDPANALPQAAQRLDASGPVRPHEVELAVERLCIDSVSYRNLADSAKRNPDAIAARIANIVAARGKMHNPETDSGGILLGTVTAVGERVTNPPKIGTRVVPMASLALTPLRLDAVNVVDPSSPRVEVRGTAYMRTPWAVLPNDVPESTALELLDVCAAPSQVRSLLPRSGTVCVLGVGHAGKLALATAREELRDGQLVALDIDAKAVRRTLELGLCDVGVTADLRDPLATLESARAAGVPPADLTVVVVNASRCESSAILLTADGGATLFFSMATNFGAATLAADGIDLGVRRLIGSTHTADRGAYALDLYRRSPALQEAFGPTSETSP